MGKYPNQFYQNEWELTPRAWHQKARSFTQEENLGLLGLLVSPRSNKLGYYREKGTMSGSGGDETDHRSTEPPVERPAPVPVNAVPRRAQFSSDFLRNLRHTRSFIPREIHRVLPCCRGCRHTEEHTNGCSGNSHPSNFLYRP